MLRTMVMLLALLVLYPQSGNADDTVLGKCTIVNTTDHPIVIGLYKPSKDGIAERLVNVPAKTELRGVPIQMADDAQFVIAFGATIDGDEISRSNPIEIYGHKRMRFIKKSKDRTAPNVMIHYRGGSSIHPARDERNTALYLPDNELEARRILIDANHTTKVVKTPLVQREFTGESSSQ